MIEVSVVTPTYRPGGIDILLAGMRDQTLPKDQFEVILVDHRYEWRHDRVMALAREYGVNLIHVPEHRRDGIWAVTSSAYNTGFALARGRVIIMLVDWTYCPPGWIEAHVKNHQDPAHSLKYVLAPYYYHAIGITPEIYANMASTGARMRPYADYASQPKLHLKIPFDFTGQDARADSKAEDNDAVLRGEVFDEISVFEEGLFDPAWLPRMPPIPDGDPGQRQAGPGATVPYTWTHLKNESVLRETVYHLNGTDIWSERGGRMSIDTEFGMRLSCLGASLIWEPAALAHCINPRHGVCRVMPFGDGTKRAHNRWSLADCQAFFTRREFEARNGGRLAAPAPYTLGELSQRLDPWRAAEPIDVAGLDKPDLEFFGRIIWPDTPYQEPTKEVRMADQFIDEPDEQPEEQPEALEEPFAAPEEAPAAPPPPPGPVQPVRGVSDGALSCYVCRQPIAKGDLWAKGIATGYCHNEPCSHR